MRELRIANNLESLARSAADLFVELGTAAIRDRDQFVVSLSGGTTPATLYRQLATDGYRTQLDWSKVFFFFGDERNVAADDPRSNYRMVCETLFEPLGISEWSICSWVTEVGPPSEVAEMYELAVVLAFDPTLNPAKNFSEEAAADILAVSQTWKHGLPCFDLFLLGLGSDGHTASLFPHSDALRETRRIAVANWVEKLNEHRFTMTFPVINNSANVVFLVSGKEKATAVRDVLEGDYRSDDLPAQRVAPTNGKLLWLIDEAAAALLKRE